MVGFNRCWPWSCCQLWPWPRKRTSRGASLRRVSSHATFTPPQSVATRIPVPSSSVLPFVPFLSCRSPSPSCLASGLATDVMRTWPTPSSPHQHMSCSTPPESALIWNHITTGDVSYRIRPHGNLSCTFLSLSFHPRPSGPTFPAFLPLLASRLAYLYINPTRLALAKRGTLWNHRLLFFPVPLPYPASTLTLVYNNPRPFRNVAFHRVFSYPL